MQVPLIIGRRWPLKPRAGDPILALFEKTVSGSHRNFKTLPVRKSNSTIKTTLRVYLITMNTSKLFQKTEILPILAYAK